MYPPVSGNNARLQFVHLVAVGRRAKDDARCFREAWQPRRAWVDAWRLWIVRALTFVMQTKRGADDTVDLRAVDARSSDLSSFEVLCTHLPCDVSLFGEIP